MLKAWNVAWWCLHVADEVGGSMINESTRAAGCRALVCEAVVFVSGDQMVEAGR